MNNIETMRLALEALKCLLAGNSTAYQAANAITSLRQAIEQAQQSEPIGASKETQRFAIQVEKLLCEKLGRKWSPSGISIQTLVDELADRQAQQAEPVAWPKTPSDISNMIGSSFVWREHKISDVEPHEEDKYCVTAHDLLESFEHWSGYTSPPPLQPEPVIDKSAAIRIATALGWTPPRQPEQCQCPKCKVVLHASDCAVHSEPAYPKGECNCGATKPEPVAWIEHHKAGDNLVWDEPSKGTPLYTSPQKQPPVIDKSVARRIASQLGWEPPRQPLTDEQWQEIANLTGCLRIEKRGRDAIMRIFDEAAYGIKGEA